MSRRSDIETKHDDDLCDIICVNKKNVDKVINKLEDDESLQTLSELFTALADPTRVKILRALSFSELCVCDIAAIVNISQSAVSHQLRYLRMSRLVRFRKDGKMAYYSLDDDHVRKLIDQGLEHARESK
ncbi:MAG: metalloregulator ArsR/SmtB family transcription factor [bacterium]|nr:metalloregulator ArsR/SmtB family transcription factor [bacterium]